MSSLLQFHVASVAALIGLLALARWIGITAVLGSLGVLIDSRGRYSLTHFQTVVWTLVILATLVGAFVASGLDPSVIEIPETLLGLMGISAGSAVFATATKAGKDTMRGGRIARVGRFTESDGTDRQIVPRLAQIWLEEEGDGADKYVSITKFQNFVFTLLAVSAYVALAARSGGVPDLPANIVWLIGISHAGYVGGKVPDRP